MNAWGKTVIAAGVAAVAALVLLNSGNHPAEPSAQQAPITRAPAPEPPTNTALSNMMAIARNVGVRKSVLTPEERAKLERAFTTGIKPAITNWCRAYAGHTPFEPEALSLDKFKEQIGRGPFVIYTFMIGGITVCFRDRDDQVVLNYVYTPEARKLMGLPNGTEKLNLNLPVSRSEVIKMVKADTGVEFAPKDLIMRPTGGGTAINGGAFVDVAPLGGNPNNGLCEVGLVFNAQGTVISYDRSPTL